MDNLLYLAYALQALIALGLIYVLMIIVGALLVYVYGLDVSFPLAALYVGIGEALACYGIGVPLMLFFEKHCESIIAHFQNS